MKEFCISSADVIRTAMNSSEKTKVDFRVDPYVIIFFSKSLLDYLNEKTEIIESEWLAPYHPYSGVPIFRGIVDEIPITAISPPMGASPLASIIEDLIYNNAKMILLVCGSWGIGENVKLLDFLIPTHAIGPDGTSIHYGRRVGEETQIDKEVCNLLIKETKKRTKNFHIGKNYSKEALYRITKEEIMYLQNQGCISMENGELNVLGTICSQKNVRFGAIFYSYFNPLDGWIIPWLEKKYKECVYLEAEIALATISKMKL